MAKIEGAITIGRPVEVVFDYVADQTNEPRYNPSMVRAEKATAGPIGEGTRFRSAVGSAGRSVEMLIEYTGYDRPRLLASTTTMKQADIDYTLTFEPVAAGTRMRWSGQVRPKGALRPLGPLITRIGVRREQRIWASLKRHLESADPQPVTRGLAMAYLKPPGFTRRVVNPVARKLKFGGVEQLTVTGRRTGVQRRVPVIPVQVGSHRYLVAPYGVSDWVRNLRAAGGGELLGHKLPEHFWAREVPVDQRAQIIGAYRRVAGRSVERYFRLLPDPGDHPVFEIEAATDERSRGQGASR